MSELLDEHGVLDAIENQKSWAELGFIKAGDEETIFIVSREDGYVARGATGILAFANTQNDAVYRLGRWEEGQAQAETMYALQSENVRLREQADALAAALESLVAECDKSIRWRDTRGMRTATDLSAFASTSYSGVLEIRRALQAALEKGGPPLSAEEMEAAKGAERGR